MRILQAHSRHATRGGADHVIDRERDLLVAAGHDVEQYFTEPASGAGLRQAAAAVWNVRAAREVRERIRAWRPDVLHVHTPFPTLSPAVFWAAHAENVATVSTVHSYRYSCIAATLRRDGHICEDCIESTLKLPGVRHRCYKNSVAASGVMTASLGLHRGIGTFDKRVGCFLTMTDFARNLLVRDGIPEDHIRVKPNCMDDPGEQVPFDDRDPVVLFVGRLVPEKGITALLAAWRATTTRGCRLVVVGDGPLRDEVESAAATDPSIDFRGWVSEEAVMQAQRSARLTVVPSEWYEAGPPLVMLQALASGTPLVTCDLENVAATAVGSGAALPFRTGDAASLAETLSRALADPSAGAAMGRAGRGLYLRDHTPEVTLEILESTYRSVTRAIAA
jgi:glycosyltransferase involved in cell wall biosynthesis